MAGLGDRCVRVSLQLGPWTDIDALVAAVQWKQGKQSPLEHVLESRAESAVELFILHCFPAPNPSGGSLHVQVLLVVAF